MSLPAKRDGPKYTPITIYHGVEVIIIFHTRLVALSAVIRRRFCAPDQVVDFDEGFWEAARFRVIDAQVFYELFNLRLRHMRLPVAEERVDPPAVTAERKDCGR